MTTLEDRYQALLALYPREHRDRFGEEMLGVLMSGAADSQRWPRLGESIDLLWNAGRQQLVQPRGPIRESAWGGAAAIVGILLTMWLAAFHLMREVGQLTWSWLEDDGSSGHVTGGPYTLSAAWLMVTLTVLSGRRRTAALLAWAILLGAGLGHASDIHGLNKAIFLSLAAAVVLTIPQRRPVLPRGVGFVFLAIGFSQAVGAVLGYCFNVFLNPVGYQYGHTLGMNWFPLVVTAAGAFATLRFLWRLDGPVRRRVFMILLATAGLGIYV